MKVAELQFSLVDDQGQSDMMLDMTIAVDYDDSVRKPRRHRCRFSFQTITYTVAVLHGSKIMMHRKDTLQYHRYLSCAVCRSLGVVDIDSNIFCALRYELGKRIELYEAKVLILRPRPKRPIEKRRLVFQRPCIITSINGKTWVVGIYIYVYVCGRTNTLASSHAVDVMRILQKTHQIHCPENSKCEHRSAPNGPGPNPLDSIQKPGGRLSRLIFL